MKREIFDLRNGPAVDEDFPYGKDYNRSHSGAKGRKANELYERRYVRRKMKEMLRKNLMREIGD